MSPQGTAWPAGPRDPKAVSVDLYHGVPGVVLFFLEAGRLTGDRRYLDDARHGADYLLAHLNDAEDAGLYTGLAGIGFTLTETFKATREPRYREAALRCLRWLDERARKVGKDVEWNDSTDIIGGSAGTGLFLLYAARELRQPRARELAVAAGEHLLELGRPERGGLRWAMDPTFPRLMPNFSHGTAGVAYFLATLYMESQRKEFLDAAIAGARYLQSIANTEGNVCLIHHHEPDGKNLYYLGWRHGPAGTARLFYRLYQITRDPSWMDWVHRAARGVMLSGIPEKLTPGFWNNVGQSCGSAGVAEFFLDLYRATGRRG